MATYFLFLAAAAPPILLAYLVFSLVKFKQLKLEVCLRLFIFGGLVGVPIIFAERAILPILNDFTQSVFLIMLIGVALIEELFKFSVVMFSVYNKDRFDAPIEAIVYVVMVGLGFAFAENVAYVLDAPPAGYENIDVAIIRMFTAIPMHALCGVFMGYFIGRAQLEKDDQANLIFLGLLIAILLHATHNTLVDEYPVIYDILLLIVALFFASSLISKGQINSGLVPQDINSDIEPSSGFFSRALDEIEAGVEDSGIWAKAYAKSSNEEETRRRYVDLRAKDLSDRSEKEHEATSRDIEKLEKALGISRGLRFIWFIFIVVGWGFSGLYGEGNINELLSGAVGLCVLFLIYSLIRVFWLGSKLKDKSERLKALDNLLAKTDTKSKKDSEAVGGGCFIVIFVIILIVVFWGYP